MKSEIEKKFDELTIQYEELFNENYGIVWGDNRSLEEHIEIIQKAISTKTPVEIPEPPEGVVF